MDILENAESTEEIKTFVNDLQGGNESSETDEEENEVPTAQTTNKKKDEESELVHKDSSYIAHDRKHKRLTMKFQSDKESLKQEIVLKNDIINEKEKELAQLKCLEHEHLQLTEEVDRLGPYEAKYFEIEKENKSLQQRITQYETENGKLKILENEIRRLKSVQEENRQYEKSVTKLKQRLEKAKETETELQVVLNRISNENKSLHEQNETVSQHNKQLEEDKKGLLLRLSKLAGATLTVDNPNIADLSDSKRPTKLAEEFAQLYDDEWTDAFEDIEIETEQEKTAFMLKILQGANAVCINVSCEHMARIKESICTLNVSSTASDQVPSYSPVDPESRSQISLNFDKQHTIEVDFQSLPPDQIQTVIELKKSMESRLFNQFQMRATDWIARVNGIDREKQINVMKYIKKCVDICWAMCQHVPPVTISFDDEHNEPIEPVPSTTSSESSESSVSSDSTESSTFSTDSMSDTEEENEKENKKIIFDNKFEPEEKQLNREMIVSDPKQAEEFIYVLHGEVKALTEDYKQLSLRLQDVDKDLKDKSDCLEEKEKQFSEIKRENQKLEETRVLQNIRKQDLEDELGKKDGELTELRTEIKSLKQQCIHTQELEEELRKKDKEKTEMTTTIEALEKECKHVDEIDEECRKKDGEIMQMTEEINSLKKQCKHSEQEFMKRQTYYDGEIKQYKTVIEEQAKEIKRLKEYEEIHPALQNELAELDTKLRHSKQAKLDIEQKLARADGMVKHLEEKIRANGIEKEELLLRLSKVAGAKLTYNNPNIADLSDDKRPTKLAEEFSELYDNEWTDAFECVDIENEQEKTVYMLNLLKRAYELCRSATQIHLTEIKTSICTLSLQANHARQRPYQEQSCQDKEGPKDSHTLCPEVTFDFDHLQDEHKKAVIELRKFVELKLSAEFEKIAVDEIVCKLSIDREKQENLYLYIKKCVNICWSMRRAEIPVAIGFPDTYDGMHLDTSIFKPYTRSGKFLDYIVWPALYLHENGPLLCKGVAQGKT